MFRLFPKQSQSWITAFCSKRAVPGHILAQEANRYLFWTSLNTNKVGVGKQIPVIIQTGDGKYYVSETTTGKRKGKDYVTVSESLASSQYKEILKKGKEFSSLETAYDAYIKALEDSYPDLNIR